MSGCEGCAFKGLSRDLALLGLELGRLKTGTPPRLERAGIDADTPTDKLYIIEKDPETGEPTGTVRESAMRLVERVAEQLMFDACPPHDCLGHRSSHRMIGLNGQDPDESIDTV